MCAQTQVLVLFRSEVEHQITVWLRGRVFNCFYRELPILGIHLSCEICKLGGISRVLEEEYVMRVETYGARELLRKQILREKHDADVSMVRTFGKEIGHRLVRLMHEVVDREKHRIATVELVCVRQTATKLDVWILTEQLLLLSVTVDYLVRRRI